MVGSGLGGLLYPYVVRGYRKSTSPAAGIRRCKWAARRDEADSIDPATSDICVISTAKAVVGSKSVTYLAAIPMTAPRLNTPRQVLFASLAGTTIEFFDFYIYATAAVLVFPRLFFPTATPPPPRSPRSPPSPSRSSRGPSGRRSSATSATGSAARRR